jgi:hypothetical protein
MPFSDSFMLAAYHAFDSRLIGATAATVTVAARLVPTVTVS